VMAAALQRAGFEVVEAGTGLEALRAVELQRPRAVVLDLMMPRLGGLDALKQIRASDPAVNVTKPVDPGYLAMSVAAALAWKGLYAG